jgi:dihydroneopterin aldolase/2-amino-4-hydroxy-6-hydroxymethyldihydropteridine diphosphokinase
MDTIVVRGIQVEGVHGLEGERDRPQPFIIDVEIFGSLERAAEKDDIGETIDYGVVAREVRDVVMNQTFELIETLAQAIADQVRTLGARSVRVKVSKPRSARTLSVDEIAVIIER